MTIYATGMSGTIGKHLSPKVNALKINLLDPKFEDQIPRFTQQDSLIHLAGVVGANLVETDITKASKINIEGTVRLATKFLKDGGGRFTYISSAHVYDKSSAQLHEESPLKPLSNYAKQKHETELQLIELYRSAPQLLCIVRVFSVLDWDVPAYSLGGAISKLADPNFNFILKNGDDIRDFLTPRKIALALEQIAKDENVLGIVNLCSGFGIKVSEAAKVMLTNSGYRIPNDRIESGTSPNPYIVGDNSRLKSYMPKLELLWTPSTITKTW